MSGRVAPLGAPPKIARGIAERHGGKVEVLTSTLGGARFRLSFSAT
jgi:signal transduction histidine kinase